VTALGRLAAVFVEPAPGPVADWAPPVPAVAHDVASLPVLCRPRDARLAGGAAGLALLRASGAATVVVCEWGGESRRGGASLATPAAHRLAAILCEHGLAAVGEGRLVRAVLAEAEREAAREARLVMDEALAPSALVLAGARGTELDDVLASYRGAIVVGGAGDDAAFSDLAAAELRAAQRSVAVLDVRATVLARALARRGLALCEPLRTALAEAVDAAGAL